MHAFDKKFKENNTLRDCGNVFIDTFLFVFRRNYKKTFFWYLFKAESETQTPSC
jgi:hypothetical protein